MEKNEVIEQEQKGANINPLDYVTIPVKEYRKMIRKIEQTKAEARIAEAQVELTEKAEGYRRWWHEEEKKAQKLQEEVDELRTYLDQAKAQIAELLGIKELEKVKEEQDA